jgi:hypothetical protein
MTPQEFFVYVQGPIVNVAHRHLPCEHMPMIDCEGLLRGFVGELVT